MKTMKSLAAFLLALCMLSGLFPSFGGVFAAGEPTITLVRKISATQLRVCFSEPVQIAGTPNMGICIVKKSDNSLATRPDNGQPAQWIDASASRYSGAWSADKTHFGWTVEAAWLAKAEEQLALLGADYEIKFGIIENTGSQANQTVDNVSAVTGGALLAATTYAAGANARAYCAITEGVPAVTQVRMLSNTQFQVIFSEPVTITGTPNMGLCTVNKTTNVLSSPADQWISTDAGRYNAAWSEDYTSFIYTAPDTWLSGAQAKLAALGDEYTIRFAIIENAANQSNATVDNVAARADGAMLTASTYSAGANARAYCDLTEVEPLTVSSVEKVGDAQFKVIFSEPVEITGTPNMGLRIVNSSTNAVANKVIGSGVCQWIDTSTGRYSGAWSEDKTSFTWTGETAWYTAAQEELAALGAGYALKFAIIDASGTTSNNTVDNVKTLADARMLPANFSNSSASECFYADILDFEILAVTSVLRLSDTQFKVTFSEPVEITGTPNMGLRIVNTATNTLVNKFGTSDPAQWISATASLYNTSWTPDKTGFTFTAGAGWYTTALAELAKLGEGHGIKFAIIDATGTTTNNTVDNVKTLSDSRGLPANFSNGTSGEAVYVDIADDWSKPGVTSVKRISYNQFDITFSAPIEILPDEPGVADSGVRIGLFVINPDTYVLSNAAYQWFSTKSTNYIWMNAEQTVLRWTMPDGFWESAQAAAGDGKEIFLGILDKTGGDNGAIDSIVLKENGQPIAATAINPATVSNRLYCKITDWNEPVITSVKQLSDSQFKVIFSEPMSITGTPNLGLCIVDGDNALPGSGISQWIDTSAVRYTWSADFTSLTWTAEIAWWASAQARLEELGGGYSIKFVIVENNANQRNRAVDNVAARAGGDLLVSNKYAVDANARAYCDITGRDAPYITQVRQQSDTQYEVIFSEGVELKAGTRLGLFIIDTNTHKLVNFGTAEVPEYFQIFNTTWTWMDAGQTTLRWIMASNQLPVLQEKAALNDNYAVVFGILDGSGTVNNGAIDDVTAIVTGEWLAANAREANDRVYCAFTDVTKPHIVRAKWDKGNQYLITFSEGVDITDGTRMGLFIIDRATNRLANFGTAEEPVYEQLFNANFVWENAEQTVLRWTLGGSSYDTLLMKAQADPGFEVRFGILDTTSGNNSVIDVVTSLATGEMLAANAKEASDRAYCALDALNVSTPIIRDAVSPDTGKIVIDGKVSREEWGEPVVVTNPIDSQLKWNGWVVYDPAAVDYEQTAKIYVSNDDDYIYIAATLDHSDFDNTTVDAPNNLWKKASFTVTLSRFDEEFTYAHVRSLKQDWERYTCYTLGFMDGVPTLYCSSQKIDKKALGDDDWAVRYDETTRTYYYELRIPYQNTNIRTGQDQVMAISAMLAASRTGDGTNSNIYHITKGCARRGGADKNAHQDNAIVLSMNRTQAGSNPNTGDVTARTLTALAAISVLSAGGLVLGRKRLRPMQDAGGK